MCLYIYVIGHVPKNKKKWPGPGRAWPYVMGDVPTIKKKRPALVRAWVYVMGDVPINKKKMARAKPRSAVCDGRRATFINM